jgi:hypothetical protein
MPEAPAPRPVAPARRRAAPPPRPGAARRAVPTPPAPWSSRHENSHPSAGDAVLCILGSRSLRSGEPGVHPRAKRRAALRTGNDRAARSGDSAEAGPAGKRMVAAGPRAAERGRSDDDLPPGERPPHPFQPHPPGPTNSGIGRSVRHQQRRLMVSSRAPPTMQRTASPGDRSDFSACSQIWVWASAAGPAGRDGRRAGTGRRADWRRRRARHYHAVAVETSVIPSDSSQRSASIAALQPSAAAVTAWRYRWSWTSPAMNTPSIFEPVSSRTTR